MSTKLTRKMMLALSAAEAAVPYRGLERTVAGWHSTHPRADAIEYHAPATIYALEGRGYLQLWHKRRIAHITDRGSQALADFRERGAA